MIAFVAIYITPPKVMPVSVMVGATAPITSLNPDRLLREKYGSRDQCGLGFMGRLKVSRTLGWDIYGLSFMVQFLLSPQRLEQFAKV